jgi:hypothetical protein
MAISIYMPTFATAREARQNPIRLKNLVREVENMLKESGMGEGDIKSYLSPVNDFIDDEVFWQDQDRGLALFLDANDIRIFRLPQQFEELVVVGSNFHITPLIPIYQGNGEFFLLSLNQKEPKIYRGSKFNLSRVNKLDLPDSLQNMFNKFYEFHSHLQFHTKTGTPNPDIPQSRGGQFHGQGGDDIDEKEEIKNFFHRFDQALMEYLDGEDIPLLLAGLSYLHPLYQEANSYPHLISEGINKDVERMEEEDLHRLAWDIVCESYEMDVSQALDVFNQLKGQDGKTTADLKEIIPAAYFKRVHTLFVAEHQHVWGRFDPEQNILIIDEDQTPANQDLLGIAAAKTLMYRGNVLVVPHEQVPGEGSAAAILRF